jgi:predicted RND superfamily exporter protein
MKFFIYFSWSVFLGLIIGSCLLLPRLKTDYSIDQFYPREHELLRQHDEISRTFRLNQVQPYLIAIELPEIDGWLNEDKISSLKKISDHFQNRSDVSQVISLTHVEGAGINQEEMVIGNLFERVPREKWKTAILENTLLFPLLITKNLKSTLMVIEPKLKDKIHLEAFQRHMLKIIQEAFPGAILHNAGVPLLQSRLSKIIQSELSLFMMFILITFCGVFYLLFSHWSAVLCAFLILVAANLFGLALMVCLDIPVNAILVTLPVIISVSIMSLLIHSLHLWASKPFFGKSLRERSILARDTLLEIGVPNALGIFTTALGFLALAPSPIPLISHYGVSVTIILSIVALLSQLMMFLALPQVTPKLRSWLDRPAVWALGSLRHPVKVTALISTLFLSGIFFLPKLNFSARLFDDLPSKDPIRTTTNLIDSSFGGMITFDLNAKSKVKDFWKLPKNLKKLQEVSNSLKKKPGIGSIVTVSDFFQGAIPDQKEQIAETFFLFSMAEKNPLNSYLTEDGRTLRIAVRLMDKTGREIEELRLSLILSYKNAFPGVSFSEGGMASYAHAINREVAEALIFDFWQPILLIGFFLIFIFRSLKWALLSCLPNFVPPMVLVFFLGLSEEPVKPQIALIFSIAMGFAFNNTLYLLSRLRQLELNNQRGTLRKAVLMEANPCLLESFVMLVGFSIFLFSEFNMNQTFGGFMLISILAGLAADLFFLPALLTLCPGAYKRPYRFPVKAIGILATIWIYPAHAMDARDILKKSQKLLDARDDEASVEMKIIEQNGESKLRSLSLQTLREKGFSMLARIQEPADIKNMAFLGQVDEEGNEKQWIYLPSSGQVRRLVTGKTKAGVLGSEISPEDLNSEAIKASKVSLQKTDTKFYWLELTPNQEASEYTKVIMKISKDDMLPKFTAYYIKDKIKKTVAFKDYKKVGSIFRAQLMSIQNHFNGRSTEIKLTSMKVNSGLNASDFSQSNLKD